MKVKLSAYELWRHQYHIVLIPKYRRNVLKLGVKTYVSRGIEEIVNYHPEIEIIKYNIQIDHVHLIIEIPSKYAVATILGKLKQNLSRKIRERFAWLDNVYKSGVFWSPGYFSSTD
jgi:putative transposase